MLKETRRYWGLINLFATSQDYGGLTREEFKHAAAHPCAHAARGLRQYRISDTGIIHIPANASALANLHAP